MTIHNLIFKAGIFALVFGTFNGIRARMSGAAALTTVWLILAWIVGAFTIFVLLDLLEIRFGHQSLEGAQLARAL